MLKLFIAESIDGFIAGPGGSLDHLAAFDGIDYGYDRFVASVDAVALGRATFDAIYPTHGWTYPERLTGFVLTSRPLPEGVPANVVACPDLSALSGYPGPVFLDGGGRAIRHALERGLVDEARIFTLPILLGSGIRLFPDGAAGPGRWVSEEVERFANGVLLCRYRVETGPARA